MKYVILLGDGMADYPISELGGKTPLDVARTPHLDKMAAEGTIGLIDTIPPGMTPGSDVANLAVLGYDPAVSHTGRGPLEAASMGIGLEEGDIAFRCNLVTIAERDGSGIMEDFTAGHISSPEAAHIIASLNEVLASDTIAFYPGVGYRHLMVWKGGAEHLATTPPHDITGKVVEPYLPSGEGSAVVRELMERSRAVCAEHPVSVARRSAGKAAPTSIWLWGQGGAPRMEPLTRRFGVDGGVISAVDLLKGIGVYAGLENVPVEGATGYTDTNYEGKASAALRFLAEKDFLFLHVEAPDEMGHEGNLTGKIAAIEDFDAKIVGPVLAGLRTLGDFRVAVMSDHPTPIAVRTHVSDPSPFAVLSSKTAENSANGAAFTEAAARAAGRVVTPGHTFMEYFMGDWRSFVENQPS